MTTREQLARIAAMAMIGTAWSGPNTITSTGISMIEEPKPTMPLMVPAARPTPRTNSSSTRSRAALGQQADERVEVAEIGPQRAHRVRVEGGHRRVVERGGHAGSAALRGDEAVQVVDLGAPALHHVLEHRGPAAGPAHRVGRDVLAQDVDGAGVGRRREALDRDAQDGLDAVP